MSYQKVLSLANKFAEDIQNESFTRRFRSLLNEMEGDYMTLRIKGLDRPALHELGKLYHNLFEIFKFNHDNSALPAIFTRFVSQQMKSIHKLNTTIQDFLQANQVDFLPGAGLKQSEVHSIKAIFDLAKITLPTEIGLPPKQLQNEKETYKPFANPNDSTKVESLIGKQ